MKTFLNWLRSLSLRQGSLLTRKMRAKYSKLFWECHQGGLYVSIWMKDDFFKMETVDFIAKYLDEMENPKTSEHRSSVISSIILPMFKEVTGKDYQSVELKEMML